MTEVKLSHWVADQLVAHGIRDAFMLTGGGAMHLNHSIGTHPEIKTTFCHHEQALAMAAEAYARLTQRMALVNVTSGPGGTNAITGVYGAFVDSIPMLVISGQVKNETTVRSTGLQLRQLGDQELDIEPIVTPITKYAAMVTDPQDHPLSSRKGDLHRDDRAAGAGLARHSARRSSGEDRSRRARPGLRSGRARRAVEENRRGIRGGRNHRTAARGRAAGGVCRRGRAHQRRARAVHRAGRKARRTGRYRLERA